MFKVNVKIFNKAKQRKKGNIKSFKATIKAIYIGEKGTGYMECFLRYQFENGKIRLVRYRHE